jgi:DNA-binding transcriptional MocR family regulator
MQTLYTKASTAVEIADDVEAQIRAGKLTAGEPLPAVRTLAQQLGISPNTVAAAYARLREAGLLVTDGRRGTRVAAPPTHGDVMTAVPAGLIDLASGNVDSGLLPRPDPAWLAEQGVLAGYDADSDYAGLLAVARRWMDSQRIAAEAVGVFSGTLDAIERALRLHARPGARVWVEDPCWPPLLALLASLRLKPAPLRVDAEGCTVPEPDEQAVALVLTARAHNPTGATLSAARLAALSKALRRRPRTLLILDDYWGPLAARPLPELGDLPEHWLYVLSTSKFLGPDLRVAVAGGNAALIGDMRRQQALGPRWVSLLLQRLAAHLWQHAMQDGGLDGARKAYAERRSMLIRAMRARDVDVLDAGEGLHLWLPVPDESAIMQALAAKGWACQAGRPFRLQSPPAIRISVGNLVIDATDRLADDLASSLRAPRRAWI